jgi:DUF1009 family protein
MIEPKGTLGLIAGAGEFPRLVLTSAKRAGMRVVVVGLRGCCDAAVRESADAFYETGIARLGRWIRIFRSERAEQVIMAGKVKKTRMLEMPPWRRWLAYLPDWTSIKVWYFKASDRRNDTLLRAVADEMQSKGVELVDSTQYCKDAMIGEGVLTRRGLSPAQEADANLGWQIAKEMGRLDVGQAVAVKDKDVIAVEAIEGTDAMIARAGSLCKAGGWTLVKAAKPNQDPRFDVPTLGPDTIERMAEARGGAIVAEAGRTLLLEGKRTIELADRHGIAIVGRQEPEATVQEAPPAG